MKLFRTSLSKRIVCAALILASILCLGLSGIVGVGRDGSFSSDGVYLYAAGRAWLSGGNPYNAIDLAQSVIADGIHNLTEFAYPPQSSTLCMLISLFGYSTAKVLLLLLNLGSIAAIVAMTAIQVRSFSNKPVNHLTIGVLSAGIIGNPFTSHIVWMGQTSLLAFAASMAAWMASQKQRWLLAGICLGFASFKPQICILLFLWFLLERNWKLLLAAVATIGVLSWMPLIQLGSIGMVSAWLQVLLGYKSSVYNVLGFRHVVGLESLLHTVGITLPSMKLVAVALVTGLWFYRDRINSADVLGLLMGISVTFVYAHDYDYICLVPLFTSLVLYTQIFPKLWTGTAAIALLMFMPQRLIRIFNLPVLNHWRTLVVIAVLVEVAVLSYAHQTSEARSKFLLETQERQESYLRQLDGQQMGKL
jgi:hypothetical protein